jgi:23S rRNA pseudouridine1911/1915/1917 synthase
MENKSEQFTIDVSLPLERMDVFLKTRYPDQSRATLQRLIAEGHIRVNGEVIRPTRHPRAGDLVTLHWPEPKPAEAQPEDMGLNILFEDESLLVINKLPGVCVHPAAGHDQHTIVNALLHHCRGQLSGIGGVARPGIVHRLDKDTSGALIAAKNDSTHRNLAQQFKERTTSKIYLALLCGTGIAREGKIDAPIERDSVNRKRMTVSKDSRSGREALTTYRVLAKGEHVTLAEVRIHTGRTHQVRVHFKHIGFPLVGDSVYGKRQNIHLKEKTRYALGRQMLHAWKLSFPPPATGKPMNFTAPLPEDFAQAAQKLTGWNPPAES